MERRPPSETSANLDAVYDDNHYGRLLEMLGRIAARLNTNYRNDRPRTPELIGQQEEMIQCAVWSSPSPHDKPQVSTGAQRYCASAGIVESARGR